MHKDIKNLVSSVLQAIVTHFLFVDFNEIIVLCITEQKLKFAAPLGCIKHLAN